MTDMPFKRSTPKVPGAPLLPQPQPDATPEELCRLGNEYLERGQLADAAFALRLALKREPSHAEAHYLLGEVQAEKNQPAEAARSYREAVTSDPSMAQAHFGLAWALEKLGQVNEAITVQKRGLTLAPDSISGHVELGTMLFYTGHLDGAQVTFRQVMLLDPENASAHQGLGAIHFEKGEFEAACESFRKAIEFAPDWSLPHQDLATALSCLGKTASAQMQSRVAQQVEEREKAREEAEALAGEANRLWRKDDESGARKVLDQALERYPEHPAAHRLMGMMAASEDHLDEAIRHFERALELDPQDLDARSHLAVSMMPSNCCARC